MTPSPSPRPWRSRAELVLRGSPTSRSLASAANCGGVEWRYARQRSNMACVLCRMETNLLLQAIVVSSGSSASTSFSRLSPASPHPSSLDPAASAHGRARAGRRSWRGKQDLVAGRRDADFHGVEMAAHIGGVMWPSGTSSREPKAPTFFADGTIALHRRAVRASRSRRAQPQRAVLQLAGRADNGAPAMRRSVHVAAERRDQPVGEQQAAGFRSSMAPASRFDSAAPGEGFLTSAMAAPPRRLATGPPS